MIGDVDPDDHGLVERSPEVPEEARDEAREVRLVPRQQDATALLGGELLDQPEGVAPGGDVAPDVEDAAPVAQLGDQRDDSSAVCTARTRGLEMMCIGSSPESTSSFATARTRSRPAEVSARSPSTPLSA